MTINLGEKAIYIRRSTAGQYEEHQQADIRNWLHRHDLRIGNVDVYAEQASDAASDRNEFRALLNAIQNGDCTDVVVWEISRIARKGLLAQEFFDSCEPENIVIHITNGNVREIRIDGTGRLVADIIASVAAEERRSRSSAPVPNYGRPVSRGNGSVKFQRASSEMTVTSSQTTIPITKTVKRSISTSPKQSKQSRRESVTTQPLNAHQTSPANLSQPFTETPSVAPGTSTVTQKTRASKKHSPNSTIILSRSHPYRGEPSSSDGEVGS